MLSSIKVHEKYINKHAVKNDECEEFEIIMVLVIKF